MVELTLVQYFTIIICSYGAGYLVRYFKDIEKEYEDEEYEDEDKE